MYLSVQQTYEQSKDTKTADCCDEPWIICWVAFELFDHEKVGDLSISLTEPVQEVNNDLKQKQKSQIVRSLSENCLGHFVQGIQNEKVKKGAEPLAKWHVVVSWDNLTSLKCNNVSILKCMKKITLTHNKNIQ